MNLNSAIMESKPERMGMYAVHTDHPGLMKGIKKRKISKVDWSLFSNDEDASKQYITGNVYDKKYKKQAKITEKIEKRLMEI